ncbi:MauE/DoxX family redox-associated membrane protein [Pseudomonas segetis]|uniref:Methylamine utilization protein MauE n=1 Tax=Pseudomonas segetis TaxID=298908 RepID=A0A239JNC5_9PSED|nr:glutaredoxin [Pseudomonas segetis]SNT06843.1 Glutaredoxin [Pseudomonas segetis]
MSNPHKQATIYRMVMDEHLCPFGLKALDLLKREGFEVEDNWLRTRQATDAFMDKHGVETTPQIFINGERIGGFDALRRQLGKPVSDPDEVTYQPVIAVFVTAALMALAASWLAFASLFKLQAVEWFVAFSMCMLASLKLRDLESFTTMFLGYDLLAQRVVRYAYAYPFAELIAGVLMISGSLVWLSAPLALFIGTIGAYSVFKAVYVEKRELKCACVGGDSNVPLGFISLTENLMMVGMGLWMLIAH